MPGRKSKQAGSDYRYSINGQEKETELNENITTAEFWEYDSRIVRRWNLDPVLKDDESPYLCFSGNPIWFSDPNGDDGGKKGKTKPLTEKKLNESLSSLEAKDKQLKNVADRIKQLQDGISKLKSLFNQKAIIDIGMFWNPAYWGPQTASDAIVGGSDLDFTASTIAGRVSELNNKIGEFNKLSQEFAGESQALKNQLQSASGLQLNSGITFDKLSAVSITVGAHKNALTSTGDWKLYEIMVDGSTFRFGIADANRVRKGGQWAGVPERLAQQLSKISRNAPELALTFRTTTLLQMSKASALKIEAEAIRAFANFHGVPIGNVSEIAKYAKEFGVSGLSVKAVTILKKFLKF